MNFAIRAYPLGISWSQGYLAPRDRKRTSSCRHVRNPQLIRCFAVHGGLSALRHLEKVRSLFQRLDHGKTGTLQKQDVSWRDSQQQSTAYSLDLPPTPPSDSGK